MGYFGGYISKAQPVGMYELKRSMSNLQFLEDKLSQRKNLNAGHQMSHMVNSMFTTLETKGILRTAPEEFMLAAEYNPNDVLNAEFIRTCEHKDFFGAAFLKRVEEVVSGHGMFSEEIFLPLPKNQAVFAGRDEVSLYGFRPRHPDCWYLSPHEFTQDFVIHRLRRPEKGVYDLTRWIVDPEPLPANKQCTPGVHFMLNVKALKKYSVVLPLPPCEDVLPEYSFRYEALRHTFVLVRRSIRVIPALSRSPLPNWRSTKEQRAKILSVYLRPWTFSENFAKDDEHVVHVTSFGIGSDAVSQEWKAYVHKVMPHALRGITNFMGACTADHREIGRAHV